MCLQYNYPVYFQKSRILCTAKKVTELNTKFNYRILATVFQKAVAALHGVRRVLQMYMLLLESSPGMKHS